MTFRVKYSLEKETTSHYKFVKALSAATAKDMVVADLGEKSHTPTVIEVCAYNAEAHAWKPLLFLQESPNF